MVIRAEVMDPGLSGVAHQLDDHRCREKIIAIADESEYRFETRGEKQQDACSHRILLLKERLTALE